MKRTDTAHVVIKRQLDRNKLARYIIKGDALKKGYAPTNKKFLNFDNFIPKPIKCG
jgi:hypothetical protein